MTFRDLMDMTTILWCGAWLVEVLWYAGYRLRKHREKMQAIRDSVVTEILAKLKDSDAVVFVDRDKESFHVVKPRVEQ